LQFAFGIDENQKSDFFVVSFKQMLEIARVFLGSIVDSDSCLTLLSDEKLKSTAIWFI